MTNSESSKDLKQMAMKYYEENKVPVQMENVLNTMFFENPSDVYGYLVNFFSKFTKPATLNKISAMPVFDSNGLFTIQTDVYCTVNNLQKHIISTTIPCADIKRHLEDQEKAEQLIQASVHAAVKFINTEFSSKLTNIDTTAQKDIDTMILDFLEMKKKEEKVRQSLTEKNEEITPFPRTGEDKQKKLPSRSKVGKNSIFIMVVPDRPLETFAVGCEFAAAVSQAVCACGALSRNIPIYRYVAKLARPTGALNEFRMPLPMVTILHCGKSTAAKVMCIKEFMIIPGIKMQLDKSLEYIRNIYHHVVQVLDTKYGSQAKLVSATGAPCPPVETVSQAFDILAEAISSQELTIGQDMYLAINCAGHEFFDRERGKYEVVTGQFKSPDEMVEFWVEILQKYPAIVAMIDPIRGEDMEHWLDLCERVTKTTFIFGDNFFERPGILLEKDLTVTTSGIVMHTERVNTISDIIDCANKFEDLNSELVISTNNSETSDTFIVDLAVGLNARFLKIGGLCRGERSCKLNRLLQIFREMEPPVETKPVTRENKLQIEIYTQENVSLTEASDKTFFSEMSPLIAEPLENKTEQLMSQTWGEEKKSCLRFSAPFIFPLIRRSSPPIEVMQEEGADQINGAS